jgi:hypothetical protein
MLEEQLSWRDQTGRDSALWIPGVGDHGGGPTEEMLEQMQLWRSNPAAVSMRSGTVREFLADLEPATEHLPVWRDELYLELHRGCATSRPDQKRHNRTLERLLLRRIVSLPCWPSLVRRRRGAIGGLCCSNNFTTSSPVHRFQKSSIRPSRYGGMHAGREDNSVI